jgi:WD40 repeat protein
MHIRIECPRCGKAATVPENILGRNVRCAGCRAVFVAAAAPEPLVDARAVAETLLVTPSGSKPPDEGTELPVAELVDAPPPDERAVAETRRDQADVPSSRDVVVTADLPPTPRVPAPPPGPLGRIGRFQLEALLGQGAFGRVFRAHDPQLERTVALKVPRLPPDRPEQVERFLSEARSAARLRHPHIVAVFEAGQAGDDFFIACEFVDGQPLSARLADKPPGHKRAAQWVRDLAKALAYAHEEGIIHRDIKPANIMIGARDRPQLMDFGLAKRVGQVARGEGGIVGTPAYMAPEQARGDPQAVGPLSDQYSLGVVLYEMLTGQRPFDGPPATVLAKLLREDPPAPRKVDRSIPRDLEAICLKAMAKRPHLRYHDAEELALDLQRWLKDEPTVARPVGRPGRALRWCLRHRLPATGIALGMLLLGLALYLAAAFSHDSAEREKRRREAELAKNLALGGKEARDQEIRREHASSLYQLGRRQCREHDLVPGLFTLAEALASLGDFYPPDLEQDVRQGLASHFRDLAPLQAILDHKGTIPLRASRDGRTPPFTDPATAPDLWTVFSPDGKTLLLRAPAGGGQLWDVHTGQPIGEPLKHKNDLILAAFSPDGKQLLTASVTDGLVRRWDPATGKPLTPSLPHSTDVSAVLFSPDGQIVATEMGKDVYLWNAATGTQIGATLRHAVAVTSIVFSPDSKFLATCAGNKAQLWDPATGRVLGEPFQVSPSVWTNLKVSFSPDSQRLLVAEQNMNSAQVWNPVTRQPIGPLYRQPRQFTIREVAPDGKTVLVTSGDNTFRLWDTATGKPRGATYPFPRSADLWFHPDGKSFLSQAGDRSDILMPWNATTGVTWGPSLPHDAQVSNCIFSPDAKVLLTISTDNTARLWDARTYRLIGRRLTHASRIQRAAFSADSKRVVTGGADKTAQVWDTATARPVGKPLDHAAPVAQVDLSPDGKIVVTAADRTVQRWDADTGEPLGVALEHDHAVTYAGFSPDGATLLTLSDGAARLWQAATGKWIGGPREVNRPNDHAAEFSPDGKLLALGAGKAVALWNPATARRIGDEVGLGTQVTHVVFSPDSRVLLAAGDRVARLVQTATGKPLGEPLPLLGSYRGAVFSPDSKTVFVHDSAGAAVLWSVDQPAPAGPRFPYERDLQCRAMSPDLRVAVILERTDRLRLMEVDTGRPLGEPFAVKTSSDFVEAQLLGPESQQDLHKTGILFSADGQSLLVSGPDGLQWLKTATGQPYLQPHPEEPPLAVTFSPDGKTLLLRGKERFQLWHRDTGRIGDSFPYRSNETSMRPFLAAFSPDGRTILTSENGKEGRSVQLRDAFTGQPLGQPLRHRTDIAYAAFCPAGGGVLTLDMHDSERVARLWQLPLPRPTGRPLEHREAVTQAAFSPDGQTVLTIERAGWRLWDVTSGQPIPCRSLSGAVAPGPDARTVLVSSGTTARVHDALTGQPVGRALPHGAGNCVAAYFSQDGKRLVMIGAPGKRPQLWDVAGGVAVGAPLELSKLENGEPYAVAFSPDGGTLLGVSQAGCRLWDTATGQPRGDVVRCDFQGNLQRLFAFFDAKGNPTVVFTGYGKVWVGDATTGKQGRLYQKHDESVQAMSPDGQRFLLLGRDSSAVRLWDPAKDQVAGEPIRLGGSVNVFSPDGTLLLTAGADRAAHLWPLSVPVPEEAEKIKLWLEVASGAQPGAGPEPMMLDRAAWQQRRDKQSGR